MDNRPFELYGLREAGQSTSQHREGIPDLNESLLSRQRSFTLFDEFGDNAFKCDIDHRAMEQGSGYGAKAMDQGVHSLFFHSNTMQPDDFVHVKKFTNFDPKHHFNLVKRSSTDQYRNAELELHLEPSVVDSILTEPLDALLDETPNNYLHNQHQDHKPDHCNHIKSKRAHLGFSDGFEVLSA